MVNGIYWSGRDSSKQECSLRVDANRLVYVDGIAIQIDPMHFSNIMDKLEASHVEKKNKESKKRSNILDYLSSHPPTQERIQRFKEASGSFQK